MVKRTKRERGAEAMAELIMQLARNVEAEANASELKPAQWSALRYLAGAAPSARTNRAFAAYHQTTTGTVTLTLKTLVEKGLLRRESDPSDKRLVRFELTDAGSATLADDPLCALVSNIEGLDGDQRAQLADILTALMIGSTRP